MITMGLPSRTVATVGGLILFAICSISSSGGGPFTSSLRYHRLLARVVPKAKTSTDESQDHACLNVDYHAIIHDKKDAIETYQEKMKFRGYHTDENAVEPLVPLKDGNIVHWGGNVFYSAWSSDTVNGTVVVGERRYFRDPHEAVLERNLTLESVPRVTVHGDHLALAVDVNFCNHYGHFKHDCLPLIAYYRSILPESTKFILFRSDLVKETLDFLDPQFVTNRIVWLDPDVIVSVKGGSTLFVTHQQHTISNGFHDLWNPLRDWMKDKLPPVPHERTVIFYKRIADTSRFGRLLDAYQEEELMQRVQNAMIKYKRPEKFVVFDGKNPDGTSMALPQQFELFHSAKTIIGPHGTGIGGNLLWVDPAPKDCESRVNVLEFIYGHENTDESAKPWLWCSHYLVYKGLPLDYHALIYTENSTQATTYIDLDMAEEFLESIWGNQYSLSS